MKSCLSVYPVIKDFFERNPGVDVEELLRVAKAVEAGIRLGGRALDTSSVAGLSNYRLQELAKDLEIGNRKYMTKAELEEIVAAKYGGLFHLKEKTSEKPRLELPPLLLGDPKEPNPLEDVVDISKFEIKYQVKERSDGRLCRDEKNSFLRFLRHVFFHMFVHEYRDMRRWKGSWYLYRDDGWKEVTEINDGLEEYCTVVHNNCSSYDHLHAFSKYPKDTYHLVGPFMCDLVKKHTRETTNPLLPPKESSKRQKKGGNQEHENVLAPCKVV